ncbi:Death domain-associated protein 6 [Camponotus floridanus]|uniref:Death domain-associated protein 6 n=1 Tax=Camponotus floridanus TaxID=104421 RepID=E1ZXE7_CAMFO|nr:Death domain-associated protein 6 [Camponotus floridanus]
MDMEIICISSDDETNSQKENKTKLDNTSVTCGKIETLSSDDEKVEGNNLKRKMLTTDTEEKIHNNMEKKKKLNMSKSSYECQNQVMALVETIFKPDLYHISNNSDKSDLSNKSVPVQPNKNQEIIEKPKLVIKEKKKISYVAHDVFPLFISLCLQKSKDKDRKDMEKIINKLKRRYEELDPEYTSSEHFVSFLNEKRAAIMKNDKKLYVYIEEVMNEMKRKFKKKSHILPSTETYDAVPSTSYAANNLSVNNAAKLDYSNDNEETANPRTKDKIKLILQAMTNCERIIKKLEEAEVDFDKEDNSTYMKVERYKQRMVELYNKYCELTGENTDAGRVYLRPKHISSTRIVVVDQAITNFINSKIARRNKIKKTGALTNDVIFPDYRDILECVSRCNDKRNLGLDRKQQKQLARKAFLELGELLQRTRRNDYWDTFSLYLENAGEDPAIKDKDLANKLIDNRTEGEKRLAAVFDKYTMKQYEVKEQNDIETSEEEEDEEGESVVDDKIKDDISVASLSEEDSDNEENINEKINKVKTENKDNTENKVNQNNRLLVKNDTSQQKYNEKDKIKTPIKENNMVISENKNQATEKIVNKVCNNNIVAKNVDVNAETPADSLPTCSTVDCTSNRIEEDLPEVVTEDMSKVIPGPVLPVIETVTEDVADVMPGAVAEIPEPIMEDITEVTIAGETEVITDDATDVIVTENQREEEKKPLLRVRSFAKPPTTWEVDSRQKIVKIAEENASKAPNQLKDVVDLTNDAINKPLPIIKTLPLTKCTIQLGNKILPLVKSQRLLIPSNRNIISVKNITNNYLKVNTKSEQTPKRDICVQLPSAQTDTTRQNQPQKPIITRNEVPFRGNETILRIIQQGKPIIVSKNSTVQSVSNQINVHFSKIKPK